MNAMDVPTGGGWENFVVMLVLALVIGSWQYFKERR